VEEWVRDGFGDLEMVEMDEEGEGDDVVDDADDEHDETTLIPRARRRGGRLGKDTRTDTDKDTAPRRFVYIL
jgi:hypothetical protein